MKKTYAAPTIEYYVWTVWNQEAHQHPDGMQPSDVMNALVKKGWLPKSFTEADVSNVMQKVFFEDVR